MRILLVSPGNNQKYGGGFYYAFHRRIMNGLIRNGHFVYPYSDRDTADYALGVRRIGKWMANQRLIEIAAEMKPAFVILLQSHLIEPDSLQQLRDAVPEVKIAAISIDDIQHQTPADQFAHLLQGADFGFATTGGETLRRFSSDKTVAYIPNPVDLSIDTETAHTSAVHDYDLIFAGHQPPSDPRWGLIDQLMARLPVETRCGLFGKRQAKQLSGYAYIQALGVSKIGLNLNRRDGDLYASDRMAQLLGNGLLLATNRASGYDAVFSEDEMLFFSSLEELADRVAWALSSGDDWRAMARAGQDKAIATMSETVVARFIVDLCFGAEISNEWAFKDHIFRAEKAARAAAAGA